MIKQKQDLLHIFRAAIQAVDARVCVRNYFYKHPITSSVALIAIGKAAVGMANGAFDAINGRIKTGIIITKEANPTQLDAPYPCYESNHPIPGEESLKAGKALLNFIETLLPKLPVLFLISGGTSSLVEVLKPSITLEQIQALNRYLLSNHFPIVEVNHFRKLYSEIKGGGLLNYLTGRPITQLLLSDVPDNIPSIIGSGLLFKENFLCPMEKLPEHFQEMLNPLVKENLREQDALVDTRILASVNDAAHAAFSAAQELGYTAYQHDELITGDVDEAAKKLSAYIENAPKGLHIWGSEVTLDLPEKPGKGGRCQHLGLLLAKAFAGQKEIFALVGKTDGHDGNTQNSGALIDGSTIAIGRAKGLNPDDYLNHADSAGFLAATENILNMGTTGTKVLDLILILKGANHEKVL